MFEKKELDALFEELEAEYGGSVEYDRLLKQAHLAIALSDAGRPPGDDMDPVVASLVEKHRPGG